jgi:two-component system, chemotaxis family, chemotaxis protein CheY
MSGNTFSEKGIGMAFNILIVDDSHIIRSMIARTIQMARVPVGEMLEAENGAQALETLSKNWIDLVMVDLNMPVMDGMTMIERMAEDNEMRNTPVVVVSTEGSESKLEKLRGRGVRAFVHKPFSPEIIRDVVKDILGDWDDGAAIATTGAARNGATDF